MDLNENSHKGTVLRLQHIFFFQVSSGTVGMRSVGSTAQLPVINADYFLTLYLET